METAKIDARIETGALIPRMKTVMKKFCLLLLFLTSICLSGCSGGETSEESAPAPPESSEGDLGEASGSPDDMFLTEPEGSSITE